MKSTTAATRSRLGLFPEWVYDWTDWNTLNTEENCVDPPEHQLFIPCSQPKPSHIQLTSVWVGNFVEQSILLWVRRPITICLSTSTQVNKTSNLISYKFHSSSLSLIRHNYLKTLICHISVIGVVYIVVFSVFSYIYDTCSTNLLFSPRAPARLSICVKHALGGQSYPHRHKIPRLMHAWHYISYTEQSIAWPLCLCSVCTHTQEFVSHWFFAVCCFSIFQKPGGIYAGGQTYALDR